MGCCAQIVLTPRARLNPPNDDKAHSVVAMPAVLHCRSPCCKLTHIFKYPNDHVTQEHLVRLSTRLDPCASHRVVPNHACINSRSCFTIPFFE